MMQNIGFGELALLFVWVPLLVLPIFALVLLWRGVKALEAIAAALRERK